MSNGMLRQAASATAAPLVRGDVRCIPLASETFAGVWSAAVLVHLPHEDKARALAEMRRIMVVGAPIFISLRIGDSDGWQPFGKERRWYSHCSYDAAVSLLTSANFAVDRAFMEDDAAARAGIQWLAIRGFAARRPGR
jgi:ubiquinone/menaquinone biosynthesis C-methylase UbiE